MDQAHEIFREWDLYDRIGQGNHMAHREIAASLRLALGERPGALRVLDVGCGDGWMSRQVFAGSRIVEFVGVDSSASALERFARRPIPGIEPKRAERTLIHASIAEALPGLLAGGFDVVHAGYVLHHYPDAAKATLLDELAQRLVPGGWLLWTDLVCDEGESRDAYIARTAAAIVATWTALSAEQRQAAVDHMWQSDFPQTVSWMSEELARRGVPLSRVLHRDPLYAALLFEKTA